MASDRLCAQLLFLLRIILFIVNIVHISRASNQAVWAINAGGERHTDSNGIVFEKDPLMEVGTASDYGRNLFIQRVAREDQDLYATERYHSTNFGYDIPIREDGNYVLILKFCEVWFAAPNQKVFDVVLNGEHTVVERLDIFTKVGRGVAHDEIVPFTVKQGAIHVNGEVSSLSGELTVEFIKTDKDNPKINAIALIKGRVEDVPRLPDLPTPQEDEPDSDDPSPDDSPVDHDSSSRFDEKRNRRTSGPPVPNPYAIEDGSNMFWPVFVAIAAFVPILFCVCKL